MDLDTFRSRLRLRHALSLVVSSILVAAATVYVLRRVPSMKAVPLVPLQDLQANIDTGRCLCSCLEGGQLECKAHAVWASNVSGGDGFNRSGCLQSLDVPWNLTGPTATVQSCSCNGEVDTDTNSSSYLCQTTFAYEEWYVHAAAFMSISSVAMALFALLWNIYYVINIHRLLPRLPMEDVDSTWLQEWLQGFWDPLHSISCWVIWCQLLTLATNPLHAHDAFPNLRQFGAAIGLETPRPVLLAPTAPDELALLGALGLFAMANWLMACLFVAPALASQEEASLKALGHEEHVSRSMTCITTTLIGVMASVGLLVGPPVSFFYGLLITVPWWLITVKQGSTSSWPLDQAFPQLGETCWQMKPTDAAWHSSALQELEGVEAAAGPAGLRTVALIQSCCRVVRDLQKLYPWRTPLALELRLQALLLQAVQIAIDAKDERLLKQLVRAAFMLGYFPPPEEDDDVHERPTPKKRRCGGCCQRLIGYQRLGEGSLLHQPQRNESWNSDIHSMLIAGLSSAVEAAQVMGDNPSVRWVGVIFAIMHPQVAKDLTGHIACAANALQSHVAEEERDNVELYQMVARAACLHPEVEDRYGTTAFGWALDLPPLRSKPTISLMMQGLPVRRNCTPNGADLAVVKGEIESATITGTRAFAPKLVMLGAPDLQLGEGQWFYEVKVLGHQAARYRVDDLLPGECRVGFSRLEHNAAALQPEYRALPHCTSVSLLELAGGPRGQGIVGCALTVSQGGQHFKASFSLDGCWGTGLTSGLPGIPRWEWSAGGHDVHVHPAISGCFVCEFAFAATDFVYGPPDQSFRPAAEAFTRSGAGNGSTLASSINADVFGSPDSLC